MKKKIIIIGNGFGGIYTLKNLHKMLKNRNDVEINLIGEKNYFLFTPLLHEVATGGINGENVVEPIRKVLKQCFSNFYLGQAKKINLSTQTLEVGEKTLSYDYLVLAPGAETNFYDIKGAFKYSLTLKSLEDAKKIKNKIIEQVEKASHLTDRVERRKVLTFVVVGGGPTGVELASEIQELLKENFSRYYEKEIIEDTSVILIQKGEEILPQFSQKTRAKSLEFLKKKGLTVLTNTNVKEVGENYVLVNDNEKIENGVIIWVAGIKPRELEIEGEINRATDGRIIVNEYLQTETFSNVFALGDNAYFVDQKTGLPLPALAQVGEKESRIVAKNISLLMNGKKLETFIYQSSGSMLSLGQWMAIGEIANYSFWGRLTWWIWRTVYLSKLISPYKKIRVALDWTLHLFSPRDISQI